MLLVHGLTGDGSRRADFPGTGRFRISADRCPRLVSARGVEVIRDRRSGAGPRAWRSDVVRIGPEDRGRRG